MKIMFGIVIILILFVVAAALALPFLVDLNRYQARYSAYLEDALNRKVSIENIRLMVIPQPGIRIEGVTVMDDPAFSSAPFASLRMLEVGVRLGPLFSRRIEVDEVVLWDPVITVIRNSKGLLNLSTLGRRAAPGPSREGPQRLLGLLAVDAVDLKGGTLTYSDRAGRQPREYVLADLDLIMKSIKVGDIVGLYLSTIIQPFNLPITLAGSFGPLQATWSDVEDLDFALHTGDAVAHIKGSATKGSLKLGVTSQVINSEELPVLLSLRKPAKIRDLQLTLETLYPPQPGVPLPGSVTNAKLEFDLDLGNSTIVFTGGGKSGDFHLEATAANIESADSPIALPLAKPMRVKDLSFHVASKYPDPDGRPIADTITVNTLAFEMNNDSSVVTVKGAGPFDNFKLTASSERIDSTDLPLGELLRKPIRLTNLHLGLEVHYPHVQVANLTFNVAGGTAQGSGGTTFGITPMPFEGSMTLQGIRLGTLMESVSNSPITVTGTGDVQLAFNWNGWSYPELLHSWKGTGHVTAKEGTFEGINLLKEVVAITKGLTFSFDSTNNTAFDTLDVMFHTKRLVIDIDRFRLRNRHMDATAVGTIGYDQSVDLKSKITLLGKRLTLPVVMQGTLKDPTYSLDAGAIGTVFKKLEEDAVTSLLKGGKASQDLLKQSTQGIKELFTPAR